MGARGAQLSGGQKQRIAIARALVKNPDVLILDEATSALDAESETLVNEALATLLRGNNTTISIAHRLSTIKRSDTIIVLSNDGTVAEMGSYRDLSTRPEGAFTKLMEWQMSGGEPQSNNGSISPPDQTDLNGQPAEVSSDGSGDEALWEAEDEVEKEVVVPVDKREKDEEPK